MTGLRIGAWEPLGDGFSLEAEAEHELPWAHVTPCVDGTWRWKAGTEDEWWTTLGQASGSANTLDEAKTAAETWLRDGE